MAKRCLILGSANCLAADIKAALDLSEFDGVVACKGAGLYWKGELDAWVSLHPDRMAKETEERRARGYPPAMRTYGHRKAEGCSHVLEYKFEGQTTSGSSGLYACKVALSLGFDRLVLCGIPLDREEGRIDGKDRWNGSRAFKDGFKEALPALAGRARSMSGWTRLLLGAPTLEWLDYQPTREAS